MPLVSILIPCFNAARWIDQTIKSALAQTWQEKEVIVVDDGSTDGSLEIIKRFDGQIRWLTGPNRGGNAARNRLLELARGEWLQYLDADDYLLPDKISQQMEFAVAQIALDVVFGPVTLEHWSERDTRRELLQITDPTDVWVLMASWGLPQTGALLWRRQSIVEVGGWKQDQPCCQEHELYLRLLIAGKRFAYQPTNGAVYRQWSNETVCKHNVPEVHRRRLDIEQRLEDHLRERSQLTPERLRAINQARFEIARIAWQFDPIMARKIIAQIQSVDPKFMPTGPSAPSQYRLVYRCLGFQLAERLAAVRRGHIQRLITVAD